MSKENKRSTLVTDEETHFNPFHGGLRLCFDTTNTILIEIGFLSGLASKDGRLVVRTPKGTRKLGAKELQDRLSHQFLNELGVGSADELKKELRGRYPLWACEEALKEGAWDRVLEVDDTEDQATKTTLALSLLKQAIVEAPDDVTTAWLFANEGKRVNEAMKLLNRECNARNLGHVLRDFGPGVGIWTSKRLARGKVWTVGRKPGQGTGMPHSK